MLYFVRTGLSVRLQAVNKSSMDEFLLFINKENPDVFTIQEVRITDEQIQGYEKNLIQLRDKEEEYIQQMNADAQLDVSAID